MPGDTQQLLMLESAFYLVALQYTGILGCGLSFDTFQHPLVLEPGISLDGSPHLLVLGSGLPHGYSHQLLMLVSEYHFVPLTDPVVLVCTPAFDIPHHCLELEPGFSLVGLQHPKLLEYCLLSFEASQCPLVLGSVYLGGDIHQLLVLGSAPYQAVLNNLGMPTSGLLLEDTCNHFVWGPGLSHGIFENPGILGLGPLIVAHHHLLLRFVFSLGVSEHPRNLAFDVSLDHSHYLLVLGSGLLCNICEQLGILGSSLLFDALHHALLALGLSLGVSQHPGILSFGFFLGISYHPLVFGFDLSPGVSKYLVVQGSGLSHAVILGFGLSLHDSHYHWVLSSGLSFHVLDYPGTLGIPSLGIFLSAIACLLALWLIVPDFRSSFLLL